MEMLVKARSVLLLAFSLGALLLPCGCSTAKGPADVEWQRVPLPQLEGSAVVLRVAHAVNPRFPQMRKAQLAILLRETQRVVKDNFDIDVEFDPIEELRIEELFTFLPPSLKELRKEAFFDFRRGTVDRPRLVEALEKGLKFNRSSLGDLLSYARPYLVQEPKEVTYPALAQALVATLLTRFQQWRSLIAGDGQPVLDASLYNEWTMWDMLGYGGLSYDVVLTNQPIASVEYYDQDLHSALRGGAVVGTTSYSKSSRYGTYIFWSTFPFTNDYPETIELRGGETYGEEEGALLSGAYLAHELGHQLLQLGHPFGVAGCVMRPVELLKFRDWYRRLDASRCRVGSNPTMQKGILPIEYNPTW